MKYGIEVHCHIAQVDNAYLLFRPHMAALISPCISLFLSF